MFINRNHFNLFRNDKVKISEWDFAHISDLNNLILISVKLLKHNIIQRLAFKGEWDCSHTKYSIRFKYISAASINSLIYISLRDLSLTGVFLAI